jgi:hypothetical protein
VRKRGVDVQEVVIESGTHMAWSHVTWAYTSVWSEAGRALVRPRVVRPLPPRRPSPRPATGCRARTGSPAPSARR